MECKQEEKVPDEAPKWSSTYAPLAKLSTSCSLCKTAVHTEKAEEKEGGELELGSGDVAVVRKVWIHDSGRFDRFSLVIAGALDTHPTHKLAL